MSVTRPDASGSSAAPGPVTRRLARPSASRFWVCMAMLLIRKRGRRASSSAYGMIDPNGCPGWRRESVASMPVRPRWTSVDARSAGLGSGGASAPGAVGGPACRLIGLLMDSPFSFPGRRARADLVVRAVAADLVRGRRLEAGARGSPRRRADDLGGGARQILLGRTMAADEPRLEEAELHARRAVAPSSRAGRARRSGAEGCRARAGRPAAAPSRRSTCSR